MTRWVTKIMAIDPRNTERGLVEYAGPEVPGNTIDEAKEYCQKNGLGYCEVLGVLIMEIPYSVAEFAPYMNDN